jgi:integrase
MTFSDYSTAWSQTYLPAMRPASITTIRSHVRKLNSLLGGKALSELTDSVVQEVVNDLNQTLCPKTVVNTMGLLHNILRRAYREGLIRVIPEPSLPEVRDQSQPWYTVGEVRQLVNVAPEPLSQLLYLLTETGLRIGEALAIEDNHVDKKAATLTVEQSVFNGNLQITKTKTSDRILSISGHMLGHLSALMAGGSGLLFQTSRGTPYRPAHLAEKLIYTAKVAGLPWHGFHAFRRTNATIMAQLGVPEQIADARQGHSNAVGLTYRLYAQRAGLQDREWAERIAYTINKLEGTHA